MCGIAGSVERPKPDPAILKSQLEQLTHRGPDSHGVYSAGMGQIGQTRLRIIDLVTGDPPISNEDGEVGVTFNGEIYNYRELQEELRAKGHTFKTQTDTEVIVHLAEECEPYELASRLQGMFAFAVWDHRRGRLILGRDRLGKKPLYYWSGGGAIVFGSEIKAILVHPAVPRRLEGSAIASYLGFGYVPTPRTFFEEILSVPPGHVLVFEPDGRPVIQRYWQLPLISATSLKGSEPTLTEAATECRRLLERAVRRRLVADVPLGAYLSGGIDSSSVVALMAGATNGPVRSFTIGFDDFEGFDERPYAKAVAQRFQTEHTEFVVKPDAIDLVERLVWHHDQPFGDSSAIPSYALAQLTKQHVTVALCGDGGDESFAGYERFGAALALSRYQLLPRSLRRLGKKAVDMVPAGLANGRVGSIQRFADRADLLPHDALRSWASYVSAEWRGRLLGTTANLGIQQYNTLWEQSASSPMLTRLLALNVGSYLLDDLLPKADRTSMAHGLELRSPFLDPELLAFAINLPAKLQVHRLSLKHVLKEAMKDLLPADVLNRRKRGFGVPLDRWFRTDLRSYLEAMIGPGARIRGHLRDEIVDVMFAEHQSARADHGQSLWTLLTLEVFLRREGW